LSLIAGGLPLFHRILQHPFWKRYGGKQLCRIFPVIIDGMKGERTEYDCVTRVACIDTPCDSGTSTLETYYLMFIARQLYAQKCLKYRKSQYWHTGHTWSFWHGYHRSYICPTALSIRQKFVTLSAWSKG